MIVVVISNTFMSLNVPPTTRTKKIFSHPSQLDARGENIVSPTIGISKYSGSQMAPRMLDSLAPIFLAIPRPRTSKEHQVSTLKEDLSAFPT